MMKNILTIFLLTLTVSCFGQTDGWEIRVGQNQDPDTSNVGVMYPSGNGNLTGRMHFVSYGTLADSISQYISAGSSYLVYTALLNQGGTSAPTATVLENTLGGTVTWSYDDVGVYLATLSGAFPDSDKVFILIGNPDNASGFSLSGWVDANSILIQTTDETFTNANDRFYRAVIEIRVYP